MSKRVLNLVQIKESQSWNEIEALIFTNPVLKMEIYPQELQVYADISSTTPGNRCQSRIVGIKCASQEANYNESHHKIIDLPKLKLKFEIKDL
jgi:hypothetical protein